MKRRLAAAAVVLAAGVSLLSCGKKTQPSTTPRARPAPEAALPGESEEGLASWYGGNDGFEGKPTASGEIFTGEKMTAAHRTLPLGTWVDVENRVNGRKVRVRINDRGPFIKGRIIDLSHIAADRLGVIGPGVAPVRLTIVAPGPVSLEVSATGRWSVQVGSFASAYRAETLAGKLRSAGEAVETAPFDGLLRVKVGPFDSKPAAAAKLKDLESRGYEGILVPADQY